MAKDQFDLMDLTVGFTAGKINSKEDFRLLFPNDDCNLIDTICKIDIGHGIESLTSSSLNKNLHKPFNKIKTKHKVTEYKRIFERDLKQRNWFLKFKGSTLHYTIPKRCQYQVHPSHIREGMRRILHKLIPSQFLGNNRNQTKISKALYNFLNTSKTEPFSLLNLVKSLNVQTIPWLQAINDPNQKSIILGKFMKWLFKFFIAIIEQVFYMTHIQGEKVFIFIDDWEAQKNDQLKICCQRSTLQLVGSVDKSSETNRLFFMPKPQNLRPITIFDYNNDQMKSLKQIKALLHYLYGRNYPKPDTPYKQELIEIFQDCNRDSNKIYLLSADIFDAYGSILQGKLFDIVRKIFQTVPDTVKFTYTFVRNVKQYQIITDEPNRLSYAPQKIEIVDKQLLLQVLKNHIFQTKVIFKGKKYNINRGIAQGSIISAILCAIYYAHMNEKYFAEIKTKGYLFTYVDDYIYVTNQHDSAKKFLEKVKRGIPEFNCTFKKLKHNLTSQNPQTIEYLGWKFNLQPLKIEPKFNSTRHSIYFNSLNIGSHELKLKNFSSLKLDKLVFTKKIHSDDHIFDMAELVCQRQAERCFALSSCLYATRREVVDIKSIIKVNGLLISKIQRLTEWDDCEKSKNKKILKLIILKAFLQVFARRHDIFSNLIIGFQRLMKILKKKEF